MPSPKPQKTSPAPSPAPKGKVPAPPPSAPGKVKGAASRPTPVAQGPRPMSSDEVLVFEELVTRGLSKSDARRQVLEMVPSDLQDWVGTIQEALTASTPHQAPAKPAPKAKPATLVLDPAGPPRVEDLPDDGSDVARKPKAPEAPPPDFMEFPLPEDFPTLVLEYHEQAKLAKEADERRKALGTQICGLLEEIGASKVGCLGLTVTRAKGANVQISAKRLAELGVGVDTITAATTRTPYFYTLVKDQE